ncbi:hypothetical protein [Aurantiacibacter spongiae]|uniref:Uncharacterized protein n=1 Tax=Aurantiacibacter spongiae TaxID=2488860 RepID=A0A3N5CX33_9SPHN|nr:hypothetical protein [Aurantiacibacter spongiae]RPF71209.1 hypothetical protein EG799_05975 [Aurantiacibacter spongiae]
MTTRHPGLAIASAAFLALGLGACGGEKAGNADAVDEVLTASPQEMAGGEDTGSAGDASGVRVNEPVDRDPSSGKADVSADRQPRPAPSEPPPATPVPGPPPTSAATTGPSSRSSASARPTGEQTPTPTPTHSATAPAAEGVD